MPYKNKKERPTKTKFWCITLFDEPKPTEWIPDCIRYYVYQKEQCPETQRIHWQAYFEIYNSVTLDRMKCILQGNPHCEERKGNQTEAIIYCNKQATRIGDPVRWGTPCKQGERSDLDNLVEAAKHYPVSMIVEKYGGNALRHINMINRYQQSLYMPTAMDRTMELIYLRSLRDNKTINCDEYIELNELLSDPLSFRIYKLKMERYNICPTNTKDDIKTEGDSQSDVESSGAQEEDP